MKFTGSLIDELMATVERAEQKARSAQSPYPEPLYFEALAVETMHGELALLEAPSVETWFASVPEIAPYESKFLGVA